MDVYNCEGVRNEEMLHGYPSTRSKCWTTLHMPPRNDQEKIEQWNRHSISHTRLEYPKSWTRSWFREFVPFPMSNNKKKIKKSNSKLRKLQFFQKNRSKFFEEFEILVT